LLLDSLDQRVNLKRCKVIRPLETLVSVRNSLKVKLGISKNETSDTLIHDQTYSGKRLSTTNNSIQVVKDTITDLLTTPDPHVGWIPDCVRLGMKIIQENNIDIILATGSPWSCLLAGVILKRKSGLPLVLDFRDPWISNPKFLQRKRFAALLDKVLERIVIRGADRIIANTDELAIDFMCRFDLEKDKVCVINNGFEDYDFLLPKVSNASLTITHIGSLYFSRDPSQLIKSVAELIESGEVPEHAIKLRFVGGIEVTNPELNNLLKLKCLQNVLESTPRLPYLDARQYMLESDILLLIQSGFPLQVPRKLYEYLASRKPMLSIGELDGATARFVKKYELGWAVQNNSMDISSALRRIYKKWLNKDLNLIDIKNLEKFRNVNLTSRLRMQLKQVQNVH
jgi:glycosyltransferase involved in cell wall biosynthesis